MEHSSSDIEEVSAATKKSRKKITAKTTPPLIFAKRVGTVMKVSPGPAAGSAPKAKTAGKIISPARKATAVSMKHICFTEEMMFSVLGR